MRQEGSHKPARMKKKLGGRDPVGALRHDASLGIFDRKRDNTPPPLHRLMTELERWGQGSPGLESVNADPGELVLHLSHLQLLWGDRRRMKGGMRRGNPPPQLRCRGEGPPNTCAKKNLKKTNGVMGQSE